MRYRPELDLVLRDVSINGVRMFHTLDSMIANIATETRGKHRDLWTNRRWEVEPYPRSPQVCFEIELGCISVSSPYTLESTKLILVGY